MTFEEEIKKAIKESNELKEAFMIEQIKPYFDSEDNKLIVTETLKIRLKEIKDYKEQIRKAIPEIIALFAEGDNENGVWGMDTNLYSSMDEAIEEVAKRLGL